MKLYLLIFFVSVFFLGCSDKTASDKAQEKALLDEVIKAHNKMMATDDQLMKNKMQLDTISAHNPPQVVKDSAQFYIKKLNDADAGMDNWMHKFDPEFKGKGHEDIMTYLSDQKKQVAAIDSQINLAIASSGKYLTKIKAK